MSTVAQGEIDKLLVRLSDVPLRIARAIERYSGTMLRLASGEGAWSATDILAHMRASDAIVAYRAYAILTRDNPTVLAYDERRWAVIARYAQIDFRFSLALYSLSRAELVNMLRHTLLEDWERVGQHEEKGPASLFDVIRSLVAHEEEHCAQLEAIQREI